MNYGYNNIPNSNLTQIHLDIANFVMIDKTILDTIVSDNA